MEYSAIKRNELSSIFTTNLDELPGNETECKKPISREYILHDLIYVTVVK